VSSYAYESLKEQYDALVAENQRLREALGQIARGDLLREVGVGSRMGAARRIARDALERNET
jgi:hypothetical protein